MKAWLQKKGTRYHLRVLLHDKEYQKSLGLLSQKAADAALGMARATLFQIQLGHVSLPEDANVIDFLISGGRVQTG